jgi:hypothetical protein
MSNKKISELELVASNASGDQFPLVQNGETMKTTMSKMSTFLGTIFTTTAAVAAQITAAITGKEDITNKQNNLTADVTNLKYPTVTATNTGLGTKLSLTGGTMSGAIAMGTSKITGLGNPTANQDAATKTYVDTEIATKQSEYNLGNTATGTTNVSIDATSGVGVFTQVVTRKTSVLYDINNTLVEAGVTKVEYGLFYDGAGYPLIMHCQILPSRIRFHIANIAVDGGSGIDTNANLQITFRII